MSTVVAYLAWAGSRGGLGDVTAFLDSYRVHPAGRPHQLVIMVTGAWSVADLAGIDRLATDVSAEVVELSEAGLDWGAYLQLAPRRREDWLCWLNTYSRFEADGWLDALMTAAEQDGVGIAGATGSWGSHVFSHRSLPGLVVDLFDRRGLFYAATGGLYLAVVDYPVNRLRHTSKFQPVPNPHLRSNAFVIRRNHLIEFKQTVEFPAAKPDTYELEAGRRGLSHFILSKGLSCVVVGRDGRGYGCSDWVAARTFRVPGQPNLLISDNQTRAYDGAEPWSRRILERSAWGRAITARAT